MLPDKQSGKKTVVPDNCLFAPDNVRDRPLIFRLGYVFSKLCGVGNKVISLKTDLRFARPKGPSSTREF
jgi:hypothetical protein